MEARKRQGKKKWEEEEEEEEEEEGVLMCVLDFEATCDNDGGFQPQEIIEVNLTYQLFSKYVTSELVPRLLDKRNNTRNSRRGTNNSSPPPPPPHPNHFTHSDAVQFHSFCRPAVHPQLTEFCTGLTGISQASVDKFFPPPPPAQYVLIGCVRAPTLAEVLQQFHEWITDTHEMEEDDFVIVTCGNWDLGCMLIGM